MFCFQVEELLVPVGPGRQTLVGNLAHCLKNLSGAGVSGRWVRLLPFC
jgi:hypothetical protein